MKKPAFKVYTTCTPPRKKSRWVRNVALFFAAWLLASLTPDFIAGLLLPNLSEAARTGNTAVLKGWLKVPLARYDKHDLLMEAIYGNQPDCARILLADKRTPPNKKAHGNMTPLQVAILRRNTEIARLLLNDERVDINTRSDITGWTALALAIYEGDAGITQQLLARPEIEVNVQDSPQHLTPIAIAIRAKDSSYLKMLLEHPEIDVNRKDQLGNTPLMCLMSSPGKAAAEMIDLLLKHPGVDINSRNNEGNTALALAAAKNLPERVKMLLTHADINVNTVNNQGMRPLNLAIQRQATECAELLRQAGAQELPEFIPAH